MKRKKQKIHLIQNQFVSETGIGLRLENEKKKLIE